MPCAATDVRDEQLGRLAMVLAHRCRGPRPRRAADPFLFLMISFAIGAAVAGIAAFFDANVVVQWSLFLLGSGVSLALLVPLGHRMARAEADTAAEGSSRWAGRLGVVLETIPGGTHATGLIRLEREKWRAETPGSRAIPAGTTVMVLRARGTRAVVVPADSDNVPPVDGELEPRSPTSDPTD